MLVSDAMPAAGLGDGTYRFADRVVTVTGLPVGDAVRMSATTAALLLGLDDRGAPTPGHRADLVELEPELRPVRVFLGGRAVRPV